MNFKNVESTQRKHDDGIVTCEKRVSSLWWHLQSKGNMTRKVMLSDMQNIFEDKVKRYNCVRYFKSLIVES